MPPRRIQPARLAFDDRGLPHAPDFGDVYHSDAGAQAQARHVFLGGNQLPQRWAGRQRFVILETGFGLGHNFLATWMAWRADPQRCERLVYLAVEKHPLTPTDLAAVHQRGEAATACPELAAQLRTAWPPPSPDWHALDFEDGRVQLRLGLGDATERLRGLQADVDAVFLDGFAPAKNGEMWSAELFQRLGRLAAPGCTAATWSAARAVRDGLKAAGFRVAAVPGFASKRDMTEAQFEPRFRPPRPAALRPLAPEPEPGQREALVVGAGLAGCAAAWALARQGWRCQVIDEREAPALATSGNAGGLMHPIFNAPDSLHARWFRAAALRTAALARPAIASARVAGRLDGFLRLEGRLDARQAQQRLDDVGLPSELVRWMEREEARATVGLPLEQGGWWFGPGGWLSPQDWSRWLLAEAGRLAGSAFLGGRRVERIERVAADAAQGHPSTRWQVLDAAGAPIAQAPVLVLANALDLPRLLPADGPRPRLGAVRGQTTVLPADSTALTPRHALSGAGYALGLEDGRRLCGATSQHDDADGRVRRSDHAANLRRAAALGLFEEAGRQAVAALAADEEPFAALGVAPESLDGRCGWRATTADRLPLVGPPPDLQAVARSRAAGARLDSPRQWPRQHDADGGLYLCTGLGSRGLTSAALAGELLAAWITGTPFPVEAELRDALDPARQA